MANDQAAGSAARTGAVDAGAVAAVRGSVVDVRFARHLPPINRRLEAGPLEAFSRLGARLDEDTAQYWSAGIGSGRS